MNWQVLETDPETTSTCRRNLTFRQLSTGTARKVFWVFREQQNTLHQGWGSASLQAQRAK